MNNVQRITKNVVLLLLSDILSKILGFFFIMYTARYLGSEGFGILSFSLAFTGIFGLIADLGLQQLTVRDVARNNSLALKYLGHIAAIKCILIIVTFSLIALVINLLNYPDPVIKVTYIISLSVIFNTFVGMFNAIFQAYETMEYISVGRIIYGCSLLIGAFFLIEHDFNVMGFASLYSLASLLLLIYSFVVYTIKYPIPKIQIDPIFLRHIVCSSLPLGLAGIFVVIYYRIDTVMLSLMIPGSNELIGWYNAAYKFSEALLFIPNALVAAVFPLLSKSFESSKRIFIDIYTLCYKLLLAAGFFIAVSLTIISSKIVLVIYGSDYINSVPALQVLVWGLIFMFVGSLLSTSLIVIGKQRFIRDYSCLGCILNICLNFLFIPSLGYVGAAITTTLTEATVTLIAMYYFAMYSGVNITKHSKPLLKLVIINGIVGLLMLYLSIEFHWAVSCFCGMIIYSVSLYIFNVFTDDELKIIKNLIEVL